MCALICLNLSHTAQAGTWSGPVYAVTDRFPDNGCPGDDTIPSGGGGVTDDCDTISAGGPIASGTVKATFTYVPANANDTAPSSLAVFETASANWEIPHAGPPRGKARQKGGYPSPSQTPSGTFTLFRPSQRPHLLLVQAGGGPASNGLGDAQQGTQYTATSKGFRLKAYPVSNNKVVTTAVSLSAHCGDPLAFTSWGYNAQLPSITPDPAGFALAPNPAPRSNASLNQYAMTGGGVFPIACSFSYIGDSSFGTRLINGLQWTIAKNPSTMLPRVANGSNTSNGNTSIFPRHGTANTPGLAFNDVLPAGNSPFGKTSITLKFEGQTVATSPIAVFYDADGFNHPLGASKWCESVNNTSAGHLNNDILVNGSSKVPNWFHYYSQVATPPCSIAYNAGDDNFDTSYFEEPGHIHLGDEVNGIYNTPIFGHRPNEPFLVEVGTQEHKGIDNFVAAMTHENQHRLLYEASQNPNHPTDTDGDLISDDDEVIYGTNPRNQYSTGSGFRDDEVYCKHREENITGQISSDWSSKGLNCGEDFGTQPALSDPANYRYPLSYTYPPAP